MDEDYSLHQIDNGWVLEIDTRHHGIGQLPETYYETKEEAITALIKHLQGQLENV